MKKRKKRLITRLVLLVIILVILVVLIWMNFFYARKCEDQMCFDSALRNCDRARFVKQGNMTFNYLILGEKSGECKVHMRVLETNLGVAENQKLIGKSMFCWVPAGVVAAPESQIDNCHGVLKEELQDMIIQNLHRQIVQNLGEINRDLGF